MISKPQTGEYAAYYNNYINLVNGDVIALLSQLKDSTYQFFNGLPDDKAGHAYAEGKWTIKQLLGHMIDAERVFAFRILCFSRGDKNNLPGFDENDYVDNAHFNNRTLTDLADEYKAVRAGNLHMLQALTDEQSTLMGTANNHAISVRALAYIMAGHELHHLRIIKERYL
jgi:uncharacterized damage-inducible protein DinB